MNWTSKLVIISCVLLTQAAFSQEDKAVIANGSTVQIEYSLTLADGSLVQSNVGGEPLAYTHGEGRLLPPLEAALAGHATNDKVEVRLAPDEAYGPVEPELFKDVPIKEIPEDAREVGAMLRASGFDGTIRVHEVREDTVVLDFNHPLAGEVLNFSVHILSVDPAQLGE